jgi:hypothetical protein
VRTTRRAKTFHDAAPVVRFGCGRVGVQGVWSEQQTAVSGQMEHTQPAADAAPPGSRAARELHSNPDIGKRYKPWFLAILAAALAIALVNGLLAWFDDGPPAAIEGVVALDGLQDTVVDGPVTYERHPPAGGPHAATTQECGLYRVPVRDENAVASLATGAVWLAFNPDLPEDKIETLQDFARGKLDVIMAPYPGLPLETGVVLTAWGRQLTLTPDQIPDPRIVRFIEDFSNGAQAPNPDADCRDGVSVP